MLASNDRYRQVGSSSLDAVVSFFVSCLHRASAVRGELETDCIDTGFLQ